ncbi:MAG: hypothetical protein ACOY5W_00840 [Pseudomonadota bacterium]
MNRAHTPRAVSSGILVLLFLTLSTSTLLIGCASVPKETVELSYLVGKDMEALHQSYKSIIKDYFDGLRGEVNRAVDNVYIPAYINQFVTRGQLIQHAQNQRADLVEAWARIAVETIDKERQARLAPINAAEQELLASVNDSFDKVIRANAIITAHLNSIRKVKEVQDEALEVLDLKVVRDDINTALAKASEKAKDVIDKINKASEKLK